MWYNTVGLVVTLILLTFWAPLAAHAQPSAKVPRIGFLRPVWLALPHRFLAQRLRELGYVEGHNIVIECAVRTGRRGGAGAAVELGPAPLTFRGGVARWPLARHAGDAHDPHRLCGCSRSGGHGAGHQSGAAGREHRCDESGGPGIPRRNASNCSWKASARRDRAPLSAGVRQSRTSLGHAYSKQRRPAARRLGVHLQTWRWNAPDELEGAFAADAPGAEVALDVYSRFFTPHRRRLMSLSQAPVARAFTIQAYVEAGGLMSLYVRHADSSARRVLTDGS